MKSRRLSFDQGWIRRTISVGQVTRQQPAVLDSFLKGAFVAGVSSVSGAALAAVQVSASSSPKAGVDGAVAKQSSSSGPQEKIIDIGDLPTGIIDIGDLPGGVRGFDATA